MDGKYCIIVLVCISLIYNVDENYFIFSGNIYFWPYLLLIFINFCFLIWKSSSLSFVSSSQQTFISCWHCAGIMLIVGISESTIHSARPLKWEVVGGNTDLQRK